VSQARNPARNVALWAMLIAAALILSYIEAMLPSLGIFKLGLANIAVTAAVMMHSRICGLCVMIVRVGITSLLFGSATSFIFSLFGGLLALTVSCILKPLYKTDKITLLGISVLSAAFHNIGQCIAASLVFASAAPFSMLWWLLLAAIPTGTLTGIAAQIVCKRTERFI